LFSADFAAHAYSITGYSGGGKKMIADYEAGGNARLDRPAALRAGSCPQAFTGNGRALGLKHAPVFTPIVGNFLKGLAVTTYFSPNQLSRAAKPQDVQALFAEYYANEPFVRVLPFNADSNLDDGFFDVQACNNTNGSSCSSSAMKSVSSPLPGWITWAKVRPARRSSA